MLSVMENSCGKPTVNMFSLEWGYRMRMKEIHRRILGGCLACLLCFTGSIPAFAAETATPANADERRENPPGLESEASETLEIGTPEAPETSEEVSLILVTEIQKEDELLSLPDFTLPLRATPSDDDLEEIYQLTLQYQTVCATVTAGEEIRQETFPVAWDFQPLTRPLRANMPQQAGLNCRRGMPLVKLSCRSFRFPSGWKKCHLLSLLP